MNSVCEAATSDHPPRANCSDSAGHDYFALRFLAGFFLDAFAVLGTPVAFADFFFSPFVKILSQPSENLTEDPV
jgi:hypothetical protein